jgi:hypothetical protein
MSDTLSSYYSTIMQQMIYCLLLEQDKYYVGYSSSTDQRRILQHNSTKGSKWCQLYPPVRVLYVKDGGLEDENNETLDMMTKHGWENVRGGSWCRVDMKSPPKELVHRTLSSQRAVAFCTRCQRCGHHKEGCLFDFQPDGDAIMD